LFGSCSGYGDLEGGVDSFPQMYLRVAMLPKLNRAKLFRHGGSQAVRLPREFRLPGTEATVTRTQSGGVLLEPVDADYESRLQRFVELAGSCPDLADVPPHSDRDIPRDQ
jgi:antitoxin VapB